MNHRLALATAILVLSVGSLAVSPRAASATSGPYLVRASSLGGPVNASGFTDMNGVAYFGAKGGAKGNELWRSDGTSDGTWRVKDIKQGSGGSYPYFLTAVGGRLYFVADDGIHGAELWITDGTGPGTRLVKDIEPGSDMSWVQGPTAYEGLVYFAAGDPNLGQQQLWRTDGTAAGTLVVSKFGPNSTIGFLTSFAGKLYFAHSGTLYQSNGTNAGTRPVRDRAGRRITGDFHKFTVVGSRLLFNLERGSYPDFHGQLWRTNGTSAGTLKLLDVTGSQVEQITNMGGTAFFTVVDVTLTTNADHLWKTGGTVATTVLVRDFPNDYISILGPAGQKLVFDDAPITGEPTVWTSDGTTEGTQSIFGPIEPEDTTLTVGGAVYFTAPEYDSNDCDWPNECLSLWRSDGTADGTYRLGGPFVGGDSMGAIDGSIYFTDFANGELWRFVP